MAQAPDALRVVVADDETLARRLLTTLLAREPEVAVVAECSNGPETIDAVRTRGRVTREFRAKQPEFDARCIWALTAADVGVAVVQLTNELA